MGIAGSSTASSRCLVQYCGVRVWEPPRPQCRIEFAFLAPACNPYQLDVSAGVTGVVIGRHKAGSVTAVADRDGNAVSSGDLPEIILEPSLATRGTRATPYVHPSTDESHPASATDADCERRHKSGRIALQRDQLGTHSNQCP